MGPQGIGLSNDSTPVCQVLQINWRMWFCNFVATPSMRAGPGSPNAEFHIFLKLIVFSDAGLRRA